MTFYYKISNDGSDMTVYDHTGKEIKTRKNDGSGFTLPDDVCGVMRDEAEKARQNENMERWRDIHIRLADNDIAPKE